MPPTMPRNVPSPIMGKHLGRKTATDEQRKRALPLRPFLTFRARPIPPVDDYASAAQAALTKMMNNDREGCCVATTIAKTVGIDTSYGRAGRTLVATDQEVSAFYHEVGGPGDNGLYIPAALEFARDKGIKIGGTRYKIDGFASVDNSDSALLDAAFHWFGGLHIGFALTRNQYQYADDGDLWDLDDSPVVGGHSIPITKRNGDRFTCATWSKQPQLTRRLLMNRRWCDECYVEFGQDWFKEDGFDQNHVNVDALRAALEAMRNGGTPDIPDDPNPPTPPGPGPGPDPLRPHEWSHTFDLFGYYLRIYAGYTVGAEQMNVGRSNYWKLIQDVLAFGRALAAKDWSALFTCAVAILADLGIELPWSRVEALVNGAKAQHETRALDLPSPPAGDVQNPVDGAPDKR